MASLTELAREYGEPVPTEDYEGLAYNEAVLVRINPRLGYVDGNVAIVSALADAPADAPNYVLQLAESNTTIRPEQLAWQSKAREVVR